MDSKNPHLGDTLKDLNSAITEWDKITNKSEPEQDVSKNHIEKDTKDLLVKLQEQIKALSFEENGAEEAQEVPAKPPESEV